VTPRTVAVFGASGFVGSAVVSTLEERGVTVRAIPTPRLATTAGDLSALVEQARALGQEHDELVDELGGVDAVVNAAGDPDASSIHRARLTAANALVPGLLGVVSLRARVPRLVHVSSAVVQGDADLLDDEPARSGFSPYSQSKVLGEQALSALAPGITVIYRPPSVHAPDRRVTRMTTRIARSALATVAAPGTDPTPQALRSNVADAVAFLATTEHQPPAVVTHPWEGLTTSELLALLGGRAPRRLPRPLARAVISAAKTAGRWSPTIGANARRVEILWSGQRQAMSWLSSAGWSAPIGIEGWRRLGEAELCKTMQVEGTS
jgi:nucleoside-diphosphate-sugar epimerase